MAFANFFDKAAMGAGQVLANFDLGSFRSILESRLVAVAFDNSAIHSRESRVSLELAINLLSRLYPRIALVPLDSEARLKRRSLVAQARAINPNIEMLGEVDSSSAVIVVGNTAMQVGHRIYLGSDGWLARISTAAPVGSADSGNPFGAATAACLGVAGIFQLIFGEQLQGPDLPNELRLSLLDYIPNAESPVNEPWQGAELGEVHLVGLGAIGNAFIWALAKAEGTKARLHLIDHESIDLSNLQRYLLTDQSTVGVPKVALAKRRLRRGGIKTVPHPQRWGAYLKETNRWDLERVLVAVDRGEDRIAIQAALPRTVINSWTQAGDIGVSRHTALNGQACLACLYMPDRTMPSEDELVAKATGLQNVREVRELLHSNAPVGRAIIERIAQANSIPVDGIASFEDRPIRAFYAEAVCGGIVLRLRGNSPDAFASVPMAFHSAMAGVMLAAEVVAQSSGLRRGWASVTTRINLLGNIQSPLSFAENPRTGCICQDTDYSERTRLKWGHLEDGRS